jgi:hypothetical protein
VLVGQCEELSHRRRADLPHRLEQPFDDGAEDLFRLDVERRARQAGVATEQERRAELVQPVDRAGQQVADDRLCRRVAPDAGQLVQVILNHGGGVILAHGRRVR